MTLEPVSFVKSKKDKRERSGKEVKGFVYNNVNLTRSGREHERGGYCPSHWTKDPFGSLSRVARIRQGIANKISDALCSRPLRAERLDENWPRLKDVSAL